MPINQETAVYTSGLFVKVISYFKIKLVIVFLFVIYSLFFDTANNEALIALFFLILGDFIFGVIASYKTGIEIKSRKIFRTVVKTIVYFALISLAFMTEKAGLGFLPIDETIIGFLAATELVSIIENVANMGYAIPKKLLNRLKEYTNTK